MVESIVTEDWCQNSEYSHPILLKPLPVTRSPSKSLNRVGSVMPELMGSRRRAVHRPGDRELLIRNILEAVGARRNVTSHRARSRELDLLLQNIPLVGSAESRKTSHPAGQPAGKFPH